MFLNEDFDFLRIEFRGRREFKDYVIKFFYFRDE